MCVCVSVSVCVCVCVSVCVCVCVYRPVEQCRTFLTLSMQLEKLESSPPSQSSHTHSLSHAHSAANTERSTTQPAANSATRGSESRSQLPTGNGLTLLASTVDGHTAPVGGGAASGHRDRNPELGRVSACTSRDPSKRGGDGDGDGKRVNFSGVGISSDPRGGRPASHEAREGKRKEERSRKREGRQNGGREDWSTRPPVTAHPSDSTSHTLTTVTPSHPRTPHTNTNAIFGPPVNFGPAPPASKSQRALTSSKTAKTSAPPAAGPHSDTHRTGSSPSLRKIDLPDGESGCSVCTLVMFSL